jgi:SAM-dependent methyltransferase
VADTELECYVELVTARAEAGPEEPGLDHVDQHLQQARELADVGAPPAARARLAGVKRWILRVLELVTKQQARFNEEIVDAVTALRQTSLATQQRLDEQRTELLGLRTEVHALLREVRQVLPEDDGDQRLRTLAGHLRGRFDDLYADFELSFRGSPAEIRDRLEVYLPIVEELEPGRVLDIGFGRGEWLDLLRERGLDGYGVDTNGQFVRDCAERGLQVQEGDALEHLLEIPEASLAAVTGFHILEHLPFENMVDLLDAALRGLRPGGCAIFETPNPTNVVVGAASFHTDPTHMAPLHPQLLEFLLQARGFVDVEVRYLHPSPKLTARSSHVLADTIPETAGLVDDLTWALYGPMDYAVIGYRVGRAASG